MRVGEMLETEEAYARPAESPRVLRTRWLGRIGYEEALSLQESLLMSADGRTTDELLLLEHDHVYTLGRGAAESDLLGAPALLDVPFFRVGRGGGVTYHGPGQLVAYPIVRLSHHGRDVQRYVRVLETSTLASCRALGVDAFLVPGSTGVWTKSGKIASIGIGVRRGIAYHGVAINVRTDLRYFDAIVACREPGLRLTTVELLGGGPLDVSAVGRTFADCFADVCGYRRGEGMIE